MAREFPNADKTDRIEAGHHTGAAEFEDKVVAAAHLVQFTGEVEGEHHLPAVPLGMTVDHRHHRADALVEGAVRAVALELVVLDEVDAGLAQRRDDIGGLPRAEADAGLDDRADQWPSLDPGEAAGSRNAEFRAAIG